MDCLCFEINELVRSSWMNSLAPYYNDFLLTGKLEATHNWRGRDTTWWRNGEERHNPYTLNNRTIIYIQPIHISSSFYKAIMSRLQGREDGKHSGLLLVMWFCVGQRPLVIAEIVGQRLHQRVCGCWHLASRYGWLIFSGASVVVHWTMVVLGWLLFVLRLVCAAAAMGNICFWLRKLSVDTGMGVFVFFIACGGGRFFKLWGKGDGHPLRL